MITNIDVEKLQAHPDNPRKDLGEITELAESIAANGILQNLTVVPWFDSVTKQPAEDNAMDGFYRVVIGHRRLAAAKLAGLLEVPCVISDMDEKKQVSIMLLENMQRSELTPREEAQGFQMLMDLGLTIEDIAQTTGLSQSTVRRRTKLLELDDDGFKAAIERGASLMDFAELEKISDIKTKNNLLEKIGTSNFNYALQSAIDGEKKAASVAALLEILDSFAERVEATDGLQSVRYIIKSTNIEFEKPEDSKGKQYYYLDTAYHVQLLVKKEQVDTTTKNSVTEETERLNSIRTQLNEISKRAYRLRIDFIKNYSAAKAKKNAHLIMEFAVCNMVKDYYKEVDSDMLCDILGVEAVKEEDFSFETISEIFALCPERVLLTTAYCNDCDEIGLSCFNWMCEYTKNEKLDSIYCFLTKLGYEMSDEEKALLDGSHELFVKKEQVEEE